MGDTSSSLLPSDAFDQMLARLKHLPNGAHTEAKAVQAVDFYGKSTAFIVQTVRTESGDTVFITQVNADGHARFIIPTDVLNVIDRQRKSTLKQVRSRHGRRLVEEGVLKPRAGGFTPEMREKAAATRAVKSARRKARREKKK